MRTETLHLATTPDTGRARCGWKPEYARAWTTEHLGDVRCRRCKALAAKDAAKAVIRPRSLAHLPGTSTEPIWTNPTYRATADEIARATADAQEPTMPAQPNAPQRLLAVAEQIEMVTELLAAVNPADPEINQFAKQLLDVAASLHGASVRAAVRERNLSL